MDSIDSCIRIFKYNNTKFIIYPNQSYNRGETITVIIPTNSLSCSSGAVNDYYTFSFNVEGNYTFPLLAGHGGTFEDNTWRVEFSSPVYLGFHSQDIYIRDSYGAVYIVNVFTIGNEVCIDMVDLVKGVSYTLYIDAISLTTDYGILLILLIINCLQ